MNLKFENGKTEDLIEMKNLAVDCWSQFQHVLTNENWNELKSTLENDKNYSNLLESSESFICRTSENKIIGMAFLVPSGNPTDIYQNDWSYIRFVSVHPNFEGHGIGKKLTKLCIEKARLNCEKTIALHTSEIMSKARHIYESMGFTILKEIDQRLGKRYWLYILELS